MPENIWQNFWMKQELIAGGPKNQEDLKMENDLRPDDEMAALLPFYVSGKLEADEHARVANWVATSDSGQRALQNALEEQHQVTSANESIPVPSGAMHKLLESLDAEPSRVSHLAVTRSLWAKLKDAFEIAPSQAAWAAAASLLLLVGIGIGTQFNPPGGQPFVVASGEDEQVAGRLAMVVFISDAPMSAITKALGDVDASIVAGPKGKATYLVRFNKHEGAENEQKRMEQLKAQTAIVKLLIDKGQAN